MRKRAIGNGRWAIGRTNTSGKGTHIVSGISYVAYRIKTTNDEKHPFQIRICEIRLTKYGILKADKFGILFSTRHP
jgi:hypothetical protein